MTCNFLGFLQALATPAIAIAGIVIAWQQVRLADIRLRNDLFERRFKIYEASRAYLLQATNNQRLPIDDTIVFSRGTNDAPLFFSQSVVDYVEEIGKQVNEMRLQATLFHEGQQAALNKAYAAQQWCASQITERKLLLKFKPEMGLSAPISFFGFKV